MEKEIRTTHVGSLPRPQSLLAAGALDDSPEASNRLREVVQDVVARQVEVGVDIVSDGEMGKPGFIKYLLGRLNGFEGVEHPPPDPGHLDHDFPGFQEWVAKRIGFDLSVEPRPVCEGPISWSSTAALSRDIANLKAALDARPATDAFMPAASVSLLGRRTTNRYYKTEEDFLTAIAETLKLEYEAIVEAGLMVQIDAPEFAVDRGLSEFHDQSTRDYLRRVEMWVEVLNHALSGIPPERVRFHLCWGNGEGPHTWDAELSDLVDVVLKVNAGAYSFEAANPRHAHEWRVWEEVALPEGKVLIPGVIDTCTNYVEHPELVAQRIERFARLVGKERVIAGTDCGFGTEAAMSNVYEPIVWAKLEALAEGAALAATRL